MEKPEKTQDIAVHEGTIQDVVQANPVHLLELAVQSGVDVEQLEKLMAMQERWEAAQARKSFYEAMSRFQAEVPKIEKTKTVDYPSKKGGRVNYSYAPIDSVVEQILPVARVCGFSHRFEIEPIENDELNIICIITHRDGHSEQTAMRVPADTSGNKNTVQSRGSAITYGQRYTLIAAYGLTTADQDDDGRQSVTKPYERNNTNTINKSGIIEAMERLFDNPEGLLDMHFGASIHDLNNDQLARLQSWVSAYEKYKGEADDCNKSELDWIRETYLQFYVIDEPQMSKAPALESLRRSMYARRKIEQARKVMGEQIHSAMVAGYLDKSPKFSIDALDYKELEELLGALITEIKAAKK